MRNLTFNSTEAKLKITSLNSHSAGIEFGTRYWYLSMCILPPLKPTKMQFFMRISLTESYDCKGSIGQVGGGMGGVMLEPPGKEWKRPSNKLRGWK